MTGMVPSSPQTENCQPQIVFDRLQTTKHCRPVRVIVQLNTIVGYGVLWIERIGKVGVCVIA